MLEWIKILLCPSDSEILLDPSDTEILGEIPDAQPNRSVDESTSMAST
jgi:hypothetical protein